jgi:hypothetical protein
MTKTEETLRELRNTAYNSEDMLDGEYNPEAHPELFLINMLYRGLLLSLRVFVNVVSKEIHEPAPFTD